MADKKMSPMMVHYLETKKQYPDCILFYRLGDFYEMFFEDAQTAASELELVLTGKDCGMDERAPMCGIPYHAAETYITRLVKKGYKVAIAEQTEDPKTAKGLVRREVIRVVTPGTIISSDALDDGRNNYLMCVAYVCGVFGLSAIDIGTGEFYLSETSDLKSLMDFYTHFSPSEIICNQPFYVSGMDFEDLRHRLGITVYALDAWYFNFIRYICFFSINRMHCPKRSPKLFPRNANQSSVLYPLLTSQILK